MLRKQQAEGGRYQVAVFSIDDLVPADRLVRKIEQAILPARRAFVCNLKAPSYERPES